MKITYHSITCPVHIILYILSSTRKKIATATQHIVLTHAQEHEYIFQLDHPYHLTAIY